MQVIVSEALSDPKTNYLLEGFLGGQGAEDNNLERRSFETQGRPLGGSTPFIKAQGLRERLCLSGKIRQ